LHDPYENEIHPGRVRRAFRSFARSGMLTGLLLVLLLAALSAAYWEHGRGNLHKLKQKIGNERPETPTFKPGGQDPIALTRTRLMGDSAPEFTSVTLLPGRGMNVLQITAFVPGRGDVNLLESPSIEGATEAMTGTGDDAGGARSLSMGAAFEAPWAGPISMDPGHAAVWRGRELPLPPGSEHTGGEAGLLLGQRSVSSGSSAMPDGGQAQATFQLSKNVNGWPWSTMVTVTALLSSKSLDLTMTAENNGDTAEPVGLGWRPRFAIEGDRTRLKLRLPAQMRVALGADGVPTGALTPVTGTPFDFTPRQGVSLGNMDLDDCFTGLRQDLLESGPAAELTAPTGDYGVRITALSPTIKALQVIAPANDKYVVLAPRFNFPDPFGREWTKGADPGIVLLQPGETAQWKIRVEVFTPTEVTYH
jgi:galactose mutarotase-like enzyme